MEKLRERVFYLEQLCISKEAQVAALERELAMERQRADQGRGRQERKPTRVPIFNPHTDDIWTVAGAALVSLGVVLLVKWAESMSEMDPAAAGISSLAICVAGILCLLFSAILLLKVALLMLRVIFPARSSPRGSARVMLPEGAPLLAGAATNAQADVHWVVRPLSSADVPGYPASVLTAQAGHAAAAGSTHGGHTARGEPVSARARHADAAWDSSRGSARLSARGGLYGGVGEGGGGAALSARAGSARGSARLAAGAESPPRAFSQRSPGRGGGSGSVGMPALGGGSSQAPRADSWVGGVGEGGGGLRESWGGGALAAAPDGAAAVARSERLARLRAQRSRADARDPGAPASDSASSGPGGEQV